MNNILIYQMIFHDKIIYTLSCYKTNYSVHSTSKGMINHYETKRLDAVKKTKPPT